MKVEFYGHVRQYNAIKSAIDANLEKVLLSGNYVIDPVATESALAYEFCYSCHDRASILANESFSRYREHIERDAASGIPGTSCHTCPASHGSRESRSVPSALQPSSTGSMPSAPT